MQANCSTRTFATIVSTESFPYALAMHKSLQQEMPNSVLYMLCLSTDVYTALEEMEYNSIYMIALGELEERNPDLCTIQQQTTVKKYTTILHTVLVEYIVRNNPLVETLEYIDAYMYCCGIPKIAVENTPISCFGDTSCEDTVIVNPYYIVLRATEEGKNAWSLYKALCLDWAQDRETAYTDGSATLLLQRFLVKYPTLLFCDIVTGYILFPTTPKTIEYRCGVLCAEGKNIVLLYTKYIAYYSKGYSTAYHGSYLENYYSMRYAISLHAKDMKAMWYKAHIFGVKCIRPIGSFLDFIRSLRKNYQRHCFLL